MNKTNIGLVALLVAVISANVQAGEFDGAYVGANLGNNKSSTTSLSDKNNGYLGLKAGYNWDWNSMLVGAEAYADAHSDSYTGQDAGLDARLGLPLNRWLPYARLGLVGTNPGTRMHGGLGVQYSLTDRWSLNAEWTTDNKDVGATNYKNNNLAVGFNFRLGGEKLKAVSAPAVVAAPAPVVEKAVQPASKPLFADKPLTLEGTSFASGSAELNASASEELDQAVEYAAQRKEIHFLVTGYTDDRGDAQQNLTLSAARAESVKAYLVKKGVAADRISTKGLGEANPVADNSSAEGRAKNRRVEISAETK